MIQRCTNPNAKDFPRYGGRGIKVCKSWRESYSAFLADMGPRPLRKTLDRLNSDGHYSRGNCRWATNAQQQRHQVKKIVGLVFGSLTVLKRWGTNGSGNAVWRCKCACGNRVTVIGSTLRSGRKIACGGRRHV